MKLPISGLLRGLAYLTGAMLSINAAAASWHWEQFGASSYSGQISLKDNTGATQTFDRFGGSSSAPLWGAAIVQSPIVLASAVGGGASANIDIRMFRSGIERTKYSCPAGTTWKLFVTPVQMCNPNYAVNLTGIRVWASETATTYTPRLAVHREGTGWTEVINNECGIVQVIQQCEEQ